MIQSVLMAALVLGSPAASADSFCDTLKQVIAATPGNFDALGGRERDKGPGLDTDVQLPYADFTCDIMTDFPGVEPARVYSCVSKVVTDTKSGDGRVLADQVGKCLGMVIDERTNDVGDPYYVAKLPGAAVVVSFDGMAVVKGGRQGAPSYYISLRVFPPKS